MNTDTPATADFDMGTPPANNRRTKTPKKRAVRSYATEFHAVQRRVDEALRLLQYPAKTAEAREDFIGLAIDTLKGE